MTLVVISSFICPSCIIMNNIVNEIKETYKVSTINYDYDEDEEIVSKYNVGKILPVFIILKDNVEQERLVGEKSRKEFINFLERNKII
ncbi:MAG: thioredoxin family protein [Bacilli bacterium]